MSKKDNKIQDNEKEITAEEVKAEEAETAAEEAEEETEAEEAVTEEAVTEEASADTPQKSENRPASSGKGKRLKHGALSVAFTVIFVAAVVLINIIFNMVLDRFDIAADLSDKSIYSIDETTAEYLAGVDDRITLIITADETAFENTYDYYKQVSEIAKRFATANSGFKLEYRDLDENPTFYTKYGATLSVGSIIVESEKTGRYVIITNEDYLSPKYYFINPSTGQSTETSYEEYYYYYAPMGYGYVEYYAATERCILSAIMNVTNEDPVRVAFLEGYGAGDSNTGLGSLLSSNAFTVETLKIETVDRIDADIDFVVILAPLYDYSNDDINKLDMWLDNGGKYGKNLMYVPAVQADVLPNLNAYLNEWGLSVGSGYVYQTNLNYGSMAYPTQQELLLEDSDYSDGVDTVTKMTLSDAMKPVTILFEESSNFKTTAIISSHSGAVIAPFDFEDWTPDQADSSGSFVVAAESTKARFEGLDPYYSRLFVVSGEYFFLDNILSNASLNNAEVTLSIFNKAVGKNDVEIAITPQAFGVTTFEITAAQAQGITITFAVVLPLLVIAAGVVVIIRRKRR